MQKRPKIGIIISTTRPGLFADIPTDWLFNIAKERIDANFEIVDLRDYPRDITQVACKCHCNCTIGGNAPSSHVLNEVWFRRKIQSRNRLFSACQLFVDEIVWCEFAVFPRCTNHRKQNALRISHGTVSLAKSLQTLIETLQDRQSSQPGRANAPPPPSRS